MKIFKNILELFENQFPDNWFDELDSDNLESEIIQKVDPIVEDIFEFFYRSILSGEYISKKHKKLLKKFDDLKLSIDQKLDVMVDDSGQQILDEHIIDKIVDPINNLISGYKSFTAQISLLTTHPFHDIGFDLNLTTAKAPNNEEIRKKLSLFFLYANVQLVDHFFSDEDYVYKSLSELLHKIKESTAPNRLKPAVIEKIRFLKHKWILRQVHYSEKDNSIFRKGFIENGEIREFFDEEEFSTNNEVLKKWSVYLEDHYSLSKKWKNNLIKEAKRINQKKIENLSLIQYHRLIKYYKDIEKNQIALREIVDAIISKYESNPKKVNRRILEKAIIYALNNHYSLLIELNEIDDVKLSQAKDEIEYYQNKFEIDNFFADKKFLKYKLDSIQNILDDRQILNHLKEEADILESLEPNMKQCRRRMQWAYEHHSLIFQLPYKDSLVPTAIDDFSGIYYASTFVLPIPRYTNQSEFKDLEIKFDKLNLLTKTISNFKPEFDEIDKMKSDLKDNDFKSLEVIGIFTAIVTFIISTIPAFKYIDSFDKALFFYTVLAGSLISLVMVIFLMRRGLEKLSRNIILIICISLLVMCAMFLFKIQP